MKRVAIFIAAVALLAACGTKEQKTIIISPTPLDSGDIIADTIIYSVLIRNFEPSDTWTSQRLQYVKPDTLINRIFESVYKGINTAYDYYTNKPLTLDEIKKIEATEGFSRDLIQELQFKEIWFTAKDATWFHKEVLSVNMGYGIFNQDGSQRGLKPVFRIRFAPKHPLPTAE
ncbi:hypothetical protein ACT3CD_13620 [Geofilum sp. OHC36d9]|uniref:hypothetical protein n=1 Tax=Geofilum sp. OHC36d9 TaxID=3458413 RepID=UPI00403360F8